MEQCLQDLIHHRGWPHLVAELCRTQEEVTYEKPTSQDWAFKTAYAMGWKHFGARFLDRLAKISVRLEKREERLAQERAKQA